jgi:uncharacterized SAM-binding protein YcdF (DUF218 family)
LAFWGLRWVIQNTRFKRRLNTQKTLLLLFGITASLPLIFIVVTKGTLALFASDPGTPADAIVMLGRGGSFNVQRTNVAAELWQAKRAPRIFASGNSDAIGMIQILQEKGIPKPAIDGENCSLTTSENAVFTAAILQPQGVRRILLVTDAPHILRSLLVFRANGFTVLPHTSPLPSYVDFKTEAFMTIREYLGLVNYAFRGLLFQQRSPELNNPDVVKLVEKAEQYSKQRRL